MDKRIKDPGPAMAEIARKEANMTGEQMKASKQLADDGKKKQKPIAAPNAKRWLDRIDRSKKVKKPFLEDSEKFLRMYQGDYSDRPGKRKTNDKMSVNIVFSLVELTTPAVFSGFPAVRVRPKPRVGEPSEQAALRARNMELVLTYWAKELGLDEILRDAFFDTFFGPATVELGWETEIREAEGLVSSEEGEEVSTGNITTIKDKPFVERRDFRSLFLDPDARYHRDCRWMAVEEVLLFNDFLASPKFTDKAKATVKAQFYPKGEEDKNWMGREDDKGDKEWLQIFIIWDKDTRQKYVVCKEYPGFLNSDTNEGEEWPYEMEYKEDPFPFCIHDAKRDRNSPYSWSEFKAYEPQILELNRIRQSIQIHVKRALPKIVFTSSAGTKQQIDKLMNSRSDEATMLDNISDAAIKEFQNPVIPPDLYRFNEIAKDDLLNVTGMYELQNQSIADTATEASLIEGRSQVRKSMRSKLWEQYIVEVFAKLGQLCQQNMDEAVAVEIAGPNGIEWLHVTKEEIQGEFFFDIEPGIMEYKNESLRKQQLLKFAELTGQDPNVNRRYLIGKVAQELDLQPEDVVLPQDQIPPPAPPKPNVSFKDIDPMMVNDSALQNAIVLAAMKQNGIPISPQVERVAGVNVISGGGEQEMPMGQPGQTMPGQSGAGKDMANTGANPNGNPMLPPVEGNLNAGGNPAELNV